MRALARLLGAAVGVLLVGSTLPAEATVPGPSDDGGPTAPAAVTWTSTVAWPPVHEEYIGEWLGPDDAVSAPRGAPRVELVLPDEVLDVPVYGPLVTVDAVDGPRLDRLIRWRVSDLSSGRIGLNLPTLLADAQARGISLTTLRVTVEDTEAEAGALYLAIDVVLVEGTSADTVVLDLGEPPAMLDSFTLRGSDVAAEGNGRITVAAWPGFFGPDAPGPITAAVYTPDWGVSMQLTDTVAVAGDGSSLTVALPAVVDGFVWLEVVVGGDAGDRYTVYAELVPPPPPAVERYVTAVYNDLFGRDPDPTGLAGWTGALMRGTPYSAVSDAITASDEFRMGLIRGAYATYLGRLPDRAGLQAWLAAMNRGLHIQHMEAGFLASQEYFDVWGAGTNAGWIRSLYIDVLGREASAADVQAWLPAIAREGREQVARGFLYSTEKLETDVDGYYRWLLRRPLDGVGRAGWVRAIQSGVRVEVIIAGIIASDEYRNNVAAG